MKKPVHKKIQPVPKTPAITPIDSLAPIPTKNSFAKELVSTLAILAAAFLLAVGLKAYVIQPYVVDGQSMETNLSDHDRLLVNKLPETFAKLRNHPYIPKRGDIIIFNQTGLPGYAGTKQLIKRVVGLPGDHVVVDKGSLTIYNNSYPKGFKPDLAGQYRLSNTNTPGQVDLVLGANQLFVCGDNRPNSEDSRAFGPIDSSQIVGRLTVRIYPFNKIHSY